jgi:hypothetical protein
MRGEDERFAAYDKMQAMGMALNRAWISPHRMSGRAAVCLLLGVFFIYNPFFTICPAAGPSSTLQHPVSYRSTIASSELGCSTIRCEKLALVPVAVVVAAERLLQQPSREIRPIPGDVSLRAVPAEFAVKLWSRPPPVQ